MSRKKARDNAFKCIYELEFIKDKSLDDILLNCYEENNNSEEEKQYIQMILNGVKENIEKIDSIILSKLKNWSLDRIAKIDLAILRLAIYEILYVDSIPNKVSANEAVELAKTYGNNDSKSFVNGVIEMILNGVKENIEKIDSIILSKLKNWSLDRIAKIDLAILRLAIYEILYVDSIPNKVSANEAVELAKTYGNNDSKSFVNGVIAKVIEDKEDGNGRKENI